MIQADALTNPWIYRQCHHVYADAAVTPRRCLACRAIDHGPVLVTHYVSGGMSGFRIGEDPYSVIEMGCRNGHEPGRMRRRPSGRYCLDCQNERRVRGDA